MPSPRFVVVNRRPLLATLAAALAGCGGYADAGDGGNGDGSRSSEGDDDEPIDAPAEDLLPAIDTLGDDWEQLETDDEHCREFTRSVDGQRVDLTSCAWVYDSVEEGETEYDGRVERVYKLATGVTSGSSESDEPPDVGVEATRIEGRDNANVVFRDANAVGSIQLEAIDRTVGPTSLEVDHENAVEYAVAMHDRWRD